MKRHQISFKDHATSPLLLLLTNNRSSIIYWPCLPIICRKMLQNVWHSIFCLVENFKYFFAITQIWSTYPNILYSVTSKEFEVCDLNSAHTYDPFLQFAAWAKQQKRHKGYDAFCTKYCQPKYFCLKNRIGRTRHERAALKSLLIWIWAR